MALTNITSNNSRFHQNLEHPEVNTPDPIKNAALKNNSINSKNYDDVNFKNYKYFKREVGVDEFIKQKITNASTVEEAVKAGKEIGDILCNKNAKHPTLGLLTENKQLELAYKAFAAWETSKFGYEGFFSALDRTFINDKNHKNGESVYARGVLQLILEKGLQHAYLSGKINKFSGRTLAEGYTAMQPELSLQKMFYDYRVAHNKDAISNTAQKAATQYSSRTQIELLKAVGIDSQKVFD